MGKGVSNVFDAWPFHRTQWHYSRLGDSKPLRSDSGPSGGASLHFGHRTPTLGLGVLRTCPASPPLGRLDAVLGNGEPFRDTAGRYKPALFFAPFGGRW